MKRTDLQNVPKAPEGFHKGLVHTLDALPERKEGISMNRKKVTKILIAAAVVAALAATAIAGGRLWMVETSTFHTEDFNKLPDTSWAKEQIGAEPKLLEAFSNGYTFESGSIMYGSNVDEDGIRRSAFTGLDLTYRSGGNPVWLELTHEELSNPEGAECVKASGLTMYYTHFKNKCVPLSYEVTAKDEEAVASGELNISWGSEEVENTEFRQLVWSADGVLYKLYGHDIALDRDELVEMAVELMNQ